MLWNIFLECTGRDRRNKEKGIFLFILLSLLSPFKIKNINWNALGAMGAIRKMVFFFIKPIEPI